MADASSFSDEILTLQTGSLANRLCLHLWNYEAYFPAQNKSSHSTDPPSDAGATHAPHLRQHILCEERFGFLAPRALALDISSSIDYGFHIEDAHAQPQSSCSVWDGTVHSVFRSNLSTPSPDSREACRQWTVCFNRSVRKLWRENDMICTLPNSAYSLDSAMNTKDETGVLSFAEGFDALHPGTQFADDVENRIRRLLERCDRPSALQLFTDAETGFIGTSLRLLDWWVDEFPKRPVISFALHDSHATSGTVGQPRLQLAARANQLILASRLESQDEGLTHATWIPLDLAAVCSPRNASVCMAPSLLAAGVSCITTCLRLDPTSGGLLPEDWIAASQYGHSRRMLTARLGRANGESFVWQTVNPYARIGDAVYSGRTSSWREAVLRGVPLNPVGDRVLQFAAAPTGTERPVDLFEELHNHSDTVSTYPRMVPGTKVSLLPQLADYAIQMTSPPLPHMTTTACGQPQTVCMASLLDAPGDGSTESKQLRQLVNAFKPYKSRSPLDGVELDQWCEFMEAGQRHLVDAYGDA